MKFILITLLNLILASGFQFSQLRNNVRCHVLDEKHPRRLQLNPVLKSPSSPFEDFRTKPKVLSLGPSSLSTSLSASIAAVTWVASSVLGDLVGAYCYQVLCKITFNRLQMNGKSTKKLSYHRTCSGMSIDPTVPGT